MLLIKSLNHKLLNGFMWGRVSKTSQELRMLSSVTINCQITKIVMKSGSQLSELYSVSQMSSLQVCPSNCQKLSQLSKLSKNCPKLLKIAQNCHKKCH